MKALLIHPRLAKGGGLEARLSNYATYFLEKGWEVHIACRRAESEAIRPGMIIHRFTPWLASTHTKNYLFNKKLERWNKPSFDFELSLGRTTIQPNILAPVTHRGFVRGLDKKTLTKADYRYFEMDQKGYDASRNIFAASKKVESELLEYYQVDPSKITVLYPPFNLNKHQPISQAEKEEIKKEFKLDPSKTYHLFVSISHDLKGLALMNSVFERLKGTEHTLLVIGHSFQSTNPNVISMGYFKDVRKAYALGDFLLHPTKYDSFAQVVTEALHHNIPVVVSPNTGAKEILTPSLGIIAPDRTVETWEEIIRNLRKENFYIPSTLITDLGMDMEAHMSKMLRISG